MTTRHDGWRLQATTIAFGCARVLAAMWNDAVALRTFYSSCLGKVARRMIVRRVRQIWPDVHGMNVLGLGYSTPFLSVFRSEAERVIALMPAPQGVVHWPSDGGGLAALADETSLPLPDRSIDRLLLVHALECAENTRPMMRELWRVLADGGRMLVVAPNRRGLWAHFEHTPFGRGRPYSPDQLAHSLTDTMFTPCQTAAALFMPPVRSRMLLSAAPALEQIGQRWFTGIAGVIIAEAEKEIYAGHFAFSPAEAKAYAPVARR
jgi:SAM-dependent methyltransferase